MLPQTIQKGVDIITKCSCMSCQALENKECETMDQHTSELPADLFSGLHPNTTNTTIVSSGSEEVPELLHLIHPEHDNHHRLKSNNVNQKFELNSKLVGLLNGIRNDDSTDNIQKQHIEELLELIRSSDHDLDDKSLLEILNYINAYGTDNLASDLHAIKKRIGPKKATEHQDEKNRNFGLNTLERGEQHNADIIKDLDDLNKPKNYGIEGIHHGVSHGKGKAYKLFVQKLSSRAWYS